MKVEVRALVRKLVYSEKSLYIAMASKFNINIEGGSGSIIMGDHTQVDITHNSGGGARPGM